MLTDDETQSRDLQRDLCALIANMRDMHDRLAAGMWLIDSTQARAKLAQAIDALAYIDAQLDRDRLAP